VIYHYHYTSSGYHGNEMSSATYCMNVSYVAGDRWTLRPLLQSILSVLWELMAFWCSYVKEVQCTMYMLFMGDGAKHWPQCIIQKHVGLKRSEGESRRTEILYNKWWDLLLNSHCLTLAEFNVAVIPQFLKLIECMVSYTVISVSLKGCNKWGWVTVAMNTVQSSVMLVNATISH
jgi:hypothetical protein